MLHLLLFFSILGASLGKNTSLETFDILEGEEIPCNFDFTHILPIEIIDEIARALYESLNHDERNFLNLINPIRSSFTNTTCQLEEKKSSMYSCSSIENKVSSPNI